MFAERKATRYVVSLFQKKCLPVRNFFGALPTTKLDTLTLFLFYHCMTVAFFARLVYARGQRGIDHNGGSSWNNNPANLRASFRNNNHPDNRNNNVGFRCVARPQHSHTELSASRQSLDFYGNRERA